MGRTKDEDQGLSQTYIRDPFLRHGHFVDTLCKVRVVGGSVSRARQLFHLSTRWKGA